jgi:hypothetical protein
MHSSSTWTKSKFTDITLASESPYSGAASLRGSSSWAAPSGPLSVTPYLAGSTV